MNNFDFLSQIKGGKQLTQSNNLSAYVVDVMPEVADSLLAMNFEHNRSVRPSFVKRFASVINRGEFVDGSQIRLNKIGDKYVLVDGQHRLSAISESGKAATMVVVVSEKSSEAEVRDEYAKLDSTGSWRSLADMVIALDAAEELPVGSSLIAYAAAFRLIHSNFNPRQFGDTSRLSMFPVMREYTQSIALTKEWLKTRISGSSASLRGYMRAGVLAVALVTTQHAEIDVAMNFWKTSSDDDGLRKFDPRKQLNDYLRKPMGKGGHQQLQMAAVAAKCWNEYIAGEEIKQLKMPKSMPDIALTPYPMKEAMPTEE